MSTKYRLTTTEPFRRHSMLGATVEERRIELDLSIYEDEDVAEFVITALKNGAFTIERIETIEKRTPL